MSFDGIMDLWLKIMQIWSRKGVAGSLLNAFKFAVALICLLCHCKIIRRCRFSKDHECNVLGWIFQSQFQELVLVMRFLPRDAAMLARSWES